MQRAGDPGKQLRQFRVDKFTANLEMKVDGGGNLCDQPQDLFGAADILIKGRIEHKDLCHPLIGKKTQLRLNPLQ